MLRSLYLLSRQSSQHFRQITRWLMLALSINSCCQIPICGKYSRAIDPASADAGGGGVTMIACWLTIRPSLSSLVFFLYSSLVFFVDLSFTTPRISGLPPPVNV